MISSRDIDISKRLLSGETLDDIGRSYSLSSARVRQIYRRVKRRLFNKKLVKSDDIAPERATKLWYDRKHKKYLIDAIDKLDEIQVVERTEILQCVNCRDEFMRQE